LEEQIDSCSFRSDLIADGIRTPCFVSQRTDQMLCSMHSAQLVSPHLIDLALDGLTDFCFTFNCCDTVLNLVPSTDVRHIAFERLRAHSPPVCGLTSAHGIEAGPVENDVVILD
jgi:hypothetical protein